LFYTYSKDKNNILPPLIFCDPNQVDDCAPAACWDTELMSEDGVRKLTAVANHVKEMVNNHWWEV
jgi:hypothetical protein